MIKKRRIRNRGCKIVWWSEEKVRLEKEESEVKERIIRITKKMRKRRLSEKSNKVRRHKQKEGD